MLLGTWRYATSSPKSGKSPTSPGRIPRGLPPQFGEVDSGAYVVGAMGQWTFRTFLHLLTLYEQREVRDVPVVGRTRLFPTTRVWWEQGKVPRGMAARVPQMVALQGIQRMREPLEGPYHLTMATV